MIQIRVSYNIFLKDLLDDLLADLHVSNPEYRSAFDVGSNPVIVTLTKEVGHVPTYYALPTNRGVTFDLKKLEELRETLVKMKIEAAEVANQVMISEFDRLKMDGQISIKFFKDVFLLQYQGESWSGSAEHIIKSTMDVTTTMEPALLWSKITKQSR